MKMKELLLRIGVTRLVASSLCGLALAVFLVFSPVRAVRADCDTTFNCIYANLCYSEGSCLNARECQCWPGIGHCEWYSSPLSCPPPP